MNKLVSIITPCYNGDVFVRRLLDSILKQTYQNIEIIFIDDGSTDNTADIVKSYSSAFENKGYSFEYIYQENSGQSVAINKGLKLFKGDYLTWPDSDDFYESDNAIEMMVNALEESNDNVSSVRCFANLLDENKLTKIGVLSDKKRVVDEACLFDDSIFSLNNFWFQPICYIVKSNILLEKIKDREIYTSKDAGQNWQIMLPVFYKHKCCFVDDYLCNVLVRSQSHSRGQYSTYEMICKKYKAYENTLLSTFKKIKDMPETEKKLYSNLVSKIYLNRKFSSAAYFGNEKKIRELYNNLKSTNQNCITKKMIFAYWMSFIPYGIRFLYNFRRIIFKIVK